MALAPQKPASPPPPAPAKHAEPPKKAEKREAPKQTALEPDAAASLFKNGHRIAKDGDPPEKWVSMGRLADGTPVFQTPMTQAIVDQIGAGSYYLIEDQGHYTAVPPSEGSAEPPPSGPPVVVDVPYASGPDGSTHALIGDTLSVTMGNWTNSPDTYQYLWKRRDANNQVNAIAGQESPTYTATNNDKGKFNFCTLRAINAVGEGTVDSNEVSITQSVETATTVHRETTTTVHKK